MEREIYENYVAILRGELVPALGCTEPIAIAYTSALARKVLGREAERMDVACSGNIIKNVKSVIVPNSGRQYGVETAAILGMLHGDPDLGLEVLQTVTEEDRRRAVELKAQHVCTCSLIEGDENLHIIVTLRAGSDVVEVETRTAHTHVVRVAKNGVVLFTQNDCGKSACTDKNLLNTRDILRFADAVDLDDVAEVLERQIKYNSAISKEGLDKLYGVGIGRMLLRHGDPSDTRLRAKAAAAAGSDARMSGCDLPVVINSGSGNQGMTASLPVLEYAKEMSSGRDTTLRALVVSNLIALMQKKHIGSLSAFCGAVCAAVGAACGIAYLHGDGLPVISATITNALATIGGMVCDGAKASCAAKIAEALDTALMAYDLAKDGFVFRPGDGLVKSDVDKTVASVGRMGRLGMEQTDVEILHIMLEND